MDVVQEPEKVVELEPLVDLDYDGKQVEVIKKGVIQRTIMELASDSLTNNNIIFQNIAPPSLSTVTDRCFRVKYKIQATVVFAIGTATPGAYPIPVAVVKPGVVRVFPAGASPYVAGMLATDPLTGVAPNVTGGGGVAGVGYTMGLRAFPLNSSLSSLELKLNGVATSISPNDTVCLQPYLMDPEEYKYFECPVQRDNSTLYAANTYQDARNPFSLFSQNTSTITRGSFVATLTAETLAGGNCTRVYEWEITEPLIISPLVWGNCFSETGLANINNITLNLRIQDIQRALCTAGTSLATAGTTITTTLTPAGTSPTASLLLNYNTQDPIYAAKMKNTLFYNWDLVQVDANSNAINGNLLNTSADGPFNGNSLRLSSIPDKIYLYIKPSKGGFAGQACQGITDTFLRIKNINVQFQNSANLLSSYTEYDLFRMSVKNGLKMTWHEWHNSVGSVVIIDVASDLGLNSDEAPGEGKYNQLKINGTYSCSTLSYSGQTTAVKYDVMTVVVTAGEALITPNSVSFRVSGSDSTTILALTTANDTKIDGGSLHRRLGGSHARGGNLFSNAGKFLHKGLHFLHKHKDHIAHGLEFAHKGLASLGLGGGLEEQHGGSVAGGSVVAGNLSRGKLRSNKRLY
jgi:hypothetical protein